MTGEHRQLLAMLANAGRLGGFCVWPNPAGVDQARNEVQPQMSIDGRPVAVNLRPIEFVNPGWVAEGWAARDPELAARRIEELDEEYERLRAGREGLSE